MEQPTANSPRDMPGLDFNVTERRIVVGLINMVLMIGLSIAALVA